MQLHAHKLACLGFPIMPAVQHEMSLLASVQGSKLTRHGCTDLLHWHSMPRLLDDIHMAKHDTCQPTRPHHITEGHQSDPSEVTSSVSSGL